MKINDAVAQFLHDNGITTIFGVMGDANMYYVDTFVRSFGGRYVSAAHEAGSTLMALGYASIIGTVGVASMTQGPALANALPALIEGVRAKLPIVLICGDISVSKTHLQSMPQRELVLATGAGFEPARSAATACRDLHTAFRRAYAERRPVVFNLPTDFQWEDVPYVKMPLRFRTRQAAVLDSDDMEEAVSLIANAKRPVIVAGRGATNDADRDAIIQFSQRIGAPLLTTLMAKDLFRDAPNHAGIMGTVGTPQATDMVLKSDCIISFGASLTPNTTLKGSLIEGRRVVMVNDELADLDNHYLITCGIVGNAASAVERFTYWLDEAEIPSSDYTSEEEVQIAVAAHQANRAGPEANAEFNAGAILKILNSIIPQDRLLVTDGGRCLGEAWRLLSVPHPSLFVLGHNSGAIGLGVSHAVGAAIAKPGKPTVLVTGDGGFMMGGLTEFNTAVRNKLDLIIVMFNDASYGSEHVQFRERGMDPSLSCFEWPDFEPVANALGGKGVTVRSLADFAEVEKVLQNRDRPILIDIKMDPDRMPPPPW